MNETKREIPTPKFDFRDKVRLNSNGLENQLKLKELETTKEEISQSDSWGNVHTWSLISRTTTDGIVETTKAMKAGNDTLVSVSMQQDEIITQSLVVVSNTRIIDRMDRDTGEVIERELIPVQEGETFKIGPDKYISSPLRVELKTLFPVEYKELETYRTKLSTLRDKSPEDLMELNSLWIKYYEFESSLITRFLNKEMS